MNKQESIPVLNTSELDDFHLKSIQWRPTISQTKHQYFHINRLETYIHNLKFPLPPHRKTVHDFIYLKKGSSNRSKGLNKFEFRASEFFFLPAFQITEHDAISQDAEGVYMHFDEKIFDFLPKNYLYDTYTFFRLQSNPVILICDENQKHIAFILERLLLMYEDDRETDINLVAHYLLTLFQEIKNELPIESKKTKNAFSQITEQYKNALSQHIYQKQSVREYADLLNISPNHLNRCTKMALDKTAQDLLNEMLILEAKTLLKFSNFQIAEIAIKLCNKTPSNFARFFKTQTGITPKEYQ